MKKHMEVKVDVIPKCDFCHRDAEYDGKTYLGSWAFMCDEHFAKFASSTKLGLGLAQKLVVR